MNADHSDYIIVGAGIVGLATAYKLLLRFPGATVTMLEKETAPAMHQTGRNSGVMHSGVYYRPGGSKAVHCLDGYHQMVAFCQKHDIPHDICGKVIVATSDAEIPRLEAIYERGKENGLNGLEWLSPQRLKAREPHVQGLRALLVPQAGIVNYAAVALKLYELVLEMGANVHFSTAVETIRETPTHVEVVTSERAFQASCLITCAGLYADRLARQTHPELDIRILPFRGEYYQVTEEARHLVRHLVYPVPDPAFPFLGVHFTRMVDGHIEAGPNAVLAFAREGYTLGTVHWREFWEMMTYPGSLRLAARHWSKGLDEMRRSISKSAFTHALQQLIPEIGERDLWKANAGVRAQAVDRKGRLLDDFQFARSARVLHVVNAPSPAATASLAIADSILRALELPTSDV